MIDLAQVTSRVGGFVPVGEVKEGLANSEARITQTKLPFPSGIDGLLGLVPGSWAFLGGLSRNSSLCGQGNAWPTLDLQDRHVNSRQAGTSFLTSSCEAGFLERVACFCLCSWRGTCRRFNRVSSRCFGLSHREAPKSSQKAGIQPPLISGLLPWFSNPCRNKCQKMSK